MTSEGVPMDGLDEQIVQVRDSILTDGEEIVAQEMGDHGQVIVLTNSRILIIKAGLTATGTFNGQKSAIYPLDQVNSVSVRKGPVGAVIQVCSENEQPAEPGCTPMNIVVFSGAQKVKRCDAIAALIEIALGKPVDKFEPGFDKQAPAQMQEETVVETEEEHSLMVDGDGRYVIPEDSVSKDGISVESFDVKSSLEETVKEEFVAEASVVSSDSSPEDDHAPAKKSRKEARSLAEEMFEDAGEWQQPAAQSVPQVPAAEPVVQNPLQSGYADEFIEAPKLEPVAEVEYAFGPPVSMTSDTSAVAVTPEPLDEPVIYKPVVETVKAAEKSHEPVEYKPNPYLPKPVMKKAHMPSSVPMLLGALMVLLFVGMAIIAPMRNAEKAVSIAGTNVADLTQNAKVIRKHIEVIEKYRLQVESILQSVAAKQCNLDAAWRQLSSLEAPAGLAAAREDLISGLFIKKAAVLNSASGSFSAKEASARYNEANALIQRGLKEIDKLKSDLAKQVPNPLSDKELQSK